MSNIPRNSLETLGIRIVTQALGMVTGILVARLLGPFGKGTYAYVSAVYILFWRANAGQASAVSWQYGKLKRPSGDVVGAMFRIWGYSALLVSLIVAAIALGVRGQLPLIAVAFVVPFGFFSQMAVAFQLADSKVRVLNVQNLITSVGFLFGFILAVVVFHLGITGMLVAWACSYVGSGVFAAIKLKPYAAERGVVAPGRIKEQVIFGLKASASTLVALLNFRIDIFIVMFVLGLKALGVYSIAVGGGELMWALTGTLWQSAFGRINSGSRAESANLTAKCVRHSMVLVLTICLLLYFVGPSLIVAVYGKAFAGAGPVLRVLLPGIVAYSMTPFFMTFFSQQLGKPTLPMLILGISTVICATITLATIRPLGIIAGAIGTSVSYFTVFVISVILFQRETGLSTRDMFGFKRGDITPYRSLLASLWGRASGIAAGGRAGRPR